MTCRNTFLFILRNGILCPQFFGIYLFHPLDIAKNESFLGGFAPPATGRTSAVFSMVLDLLLPKHGVHKDTARYVSSYSKPFGLLLKEQTNCPPKLGNFTDNNFNLSK